MKESFDFDRAEFVALITDVYVAGFMDGRNTARLPFDTDMVLNSAFKVADNMAGIDDRQENV